MNKKTFYNSHFTPKGDYEANWNKAVGFIPLDKEIIIYKPDVSHPVARFKVGDGKTVVQDLPFAGTDMTAIKTLIDEKGKLLIEYVDNAVSGLASKEWVTESFETAGISIKQYIDNSVEGLASKEYVNEAVSGLASEEYVNEAVAAINIPEQIQSNWNQTNENAKDYIKNKPTIPVIPEGLATETYVKEQIASIDIPEVDQVYGAESENAQSGIAVTEALSIFKEDYKKATANDILSIFEEA